MSGKQMTKPNQELKKDSSGGTCKPQHKECNSLSMIEINSYYEKLQMETCFLDLPLFI